MTGDPVGTRASPALRRPRVLSRLAVRRADPLHAAALAAVGVTAVAVGLIAGRAPAIGAGLVVALAFTWLLVSDLALGVCLFAFVAFLEVLPGVGDVSLAKLTGGLLALCWLGVTMTRGQKRQSLLSAHPGLSVVCILFVAWAAASLIWAEDDGKAITSVNRYALNLLLLPIVYTAMRERKHAVALVTVFIVGALLSAAYGYFFGTNLDIGEGTERLGGAGVNANTLAFQLVAALVLAAGIASNSGFPPLWRFAAAIAAFLCGLTTLTTVSRSGVIALAVAMIAGTLLAGPRRRAAMALVAITVAMGTYLYFSDFAPEAARDRITTVSGGSGRSDLWTIGLRMVDAHPVRGVGTGNFSNNSIHYLLEPGAIVRDDFIVDIPKVAHNIYLEVLAELGVPGLALFLAVLIGAMGTGLVAARTFARIGDTHMELVARSVVVACIGILTAEFFASEQYNKPLWLLLSLCPALLAIAREDEAAAAQPAQRGITPPIPERGYRPVRALPPLGG
jgi:O-antigen ligase